MLLYIQNIKEIQLKIYVTAEDCLPLYSTEGAAGADLRSIEDLILLPSQIKLVKTGIRMAIPEGYEVQVRPRSGLALKHGITIPNSPGTVDSDYTGDVGVILQNLGTQPFVIEKGDRIAQMVMAKVERAEFEKVTQLPETDRGESGFGSTKIK